MRSSGAVAAATQQAANAAGPPPAFAVEVHDTFTGWTQTAASVDRGTAGDDMLYLVCVQGNHAVTGPSGPTRIANATQSDSWINASWPYLELYRWEGVTGSGDITWTCATAESGWCIVALKVVGGISGLTRGVWVTNRTTEGTTVNCPAIASGIVAGDLVLHIGCMLKTTLSTDPDTGFTAWNAGWSPLAGTGLTNGSLALTGTGSRRPRMQIYTRTADATSEAVDNITSASQQLLGVSMAIGKAA